jgi:serine/threonine-protein kinase
MRRCVTLLPNSKCFFVAFLLALSTLSMIGNQLSTSVQGLPQYGSPQALVTGQSYAIDIAIDSAGNIYWANQGNGLLLKLPKGSTNPTVLLSGLQNVQGVGVDAVGNVYYDEYFQGTLYRLPPRSSTPQVLQTGLDYPNFMSVAADGTVFFVTGQTCGDKIVRFNPTTNTITTMLTAPTPHDTAHGFGGLFIHPSGDLYYTTCQYNTINRLPAGTSTPQVTLNAPYPSGISVDNQGNLFYTLYLNGIDVLPYGSTTPMVIASGPSAYGHQMALDSSGDIFYTASDGTTIWQIPVTSPVTIAMTATPVPTQTNTEVVASAGQGQTLPVTAILATILIASLALLAFILTRRRISKVN